MARIPSRRFVTVPPGVPGDAFDGIGPRFAPGDYAPRTVSPALPLGRSGIQLHRDRQRLAGANQVDIHLAAGKRSDDPRHRRGSVNVCPSIATMMSPGTIPAAPAGELLVTVSTTIPSLTREARLLLGIERTRDEAQIGGRVLPQ